MRHVRFTTHYQRYTSALAALQQRPKKGKNALFLTLFQSYEKIYGGRGPDFCFFEKIQLESFQKTHFWPGAPQGGGGQKIRTS